MAALIYATSFTGCTPPGGHTSSGGYSTFDSNTAEPSGIDPEYSDNSSGGQISVPFSDTESVSDGSSDQISSSDGSGESDSSNVSAVVDSESNTNSSVNESTGSVPAQSSSSTPSSTQPPPASSAVIVDPKPPVEVVIPDFPVPTSSGEKIFSSSGGWVNYSNASDGYISAMYTGTKLRAKLRVFANGETPYDFDLSIGGVIQYFPLSYGNGTYTVMLLEQIEGISYATLLRNEFEVNITNPRSPYMYSNRYVKYDKNSKCVYKAAELCAGKTDNISKIAAVFQWVTDNVTYDYQLAATVKSNTAYYPDPDKTYQNRTGICYDYAALIAAMLRSQGIPTRLVKGYAGDLWHAWNEVYTEQTGWITPELLLGNNGYNTVDATFYAGSSDKARIAAYISNPSNYSAAFYY